jgi:hypothetical protein
VYATFILLTLAGRDLLFASIPHIQVQTAHVPLGFGLVSHSHCRGMQLNPSSSNMLKTCTALNHALRNYSSPAKPFSLRKSHCTASCKRL